MQMNYKDYGGWSSKISVERDVGSVDKKNLTKGIIRMKKISSKIIIFFVALCFSLTLCGPIQADEGRKININTAAKEELMQLQKIGPQKAEAIIHYRETVGSFENPEDIVNVSGIGKATYEINKDLIAVTPQASE